MKPQFVQLQTTVDDRDVADQLIREAVERRLAACGQLLGPIESTYWWRDSIEAATEWLCLFKTRAARAKALEEFILEKHPYEVPEIVVVGIADVSEDYGDWIKDETTG